MHRASGSTPSRPRNVPPGEIHAAPAPARVSSAEHDRAGSREGWLDEPMTLYTYTTRGRSPTFQEGTMSTRPDSSDADRRNIVLTWLRGLVTDGRSQMPEIDQGTLRRWADEYF